MSFEDYEEKIELDEGLFNKLRVREIIHWDKYLEKWQFTNPAFITVSTKPREEVKE